MRRMRSAIVGILMFSAFPAAGVAQRTPPKAVDGAREATDAYGRFIGWDVGIPENPITILPLEGEGYARGRQFGPLSMTHEYQPRSITTVPEWEEARADIRKRVLGFLGTMPPADLPLEPKDGPVGDEGDYQTRRVSIAFDKGQRAELCLVIPKGLPAPAPAIVLYGGYDCGIRKNVEGFYCRAYGVGLARLGMIVAVQDHWYEQYGTSGEGQIIPLAASVHMGRRILDYLATRKDLVAPGQIGLLGHVYGAEIAPFLAALDERVAAVVTSCGSDLVIGPEMPYWPGPVWLGRYPSLGCVQRYSPRLFVGTRTYDLGPTHGEGSRSHARLPFLSQEFRALMAPRPYLSIQENPALVDCVRQVWKLYGREDAVEAITHKWKTNLPVNAQEYLVDFFLRGMCGVHPGRAPDAVVSRIRAGLQAKDAQEQLRAAWLACWWKVPQAAEELDRLIRTGDAGVRRVAARALARAGEMDRLLQHFRDRDPIVRLTVAEAIQLHGRQEHFDALYQRQDDADRWAREAKAQAFAVKPKS